MLFYLFSLVIWYLFFRLPQTYGFILQGFNADDLRMTFRQNKSEYNKGEQRIVDEMLRMS